MIAWRGAECSSTSLSDNQKSSGNTSIENLREEVGRYYEEESKLDAWIAKFKNAPIVTNKISTTNLEKDKVEGEHNNLYYTSADLMPVLPIHDRIASLNNVISTIIICAPANSLL